MAETRNCRRCGKLFSYLGGPPICAACREKDEEDFKRVKEYLYQNPGATMSDVSLALDISVERIKTYLKQGRLEIVGDEANIVLECENCGKSIKTGRFCDECQRAMSKQFGSAADLMSKSYEESAANKAVGLRYLNKDIKK